MKSENKSEIHSCSGSNMSSIYSTLRGEKVALHLRASCGGNLYKNALLLLNGSFPTLLCANKNRATICAYVPNNSLTLKCRFTDAQAATPQHTFFFCLPHSTHKEMGKTKIPNTCSTFPQILLYLSTDQFKDTGVFHGKQEFNYAIGISASGSDYLNSIPPYD